MNEVKDKGNLDNDALLKSYYEPKQLLSSDKEKEILLSKEGKMYAVSVVKIEPLQSVMLQNLKGSSINYFLLFN